MANYSVTNFLGDYSTGDKLLYIYNTAGILSQIINPYSSTYYTKGVCVNILTNGQLESYNSILDFASTDEASQALSLLNIANQHFIADINQALLDYVSISGGTITGNLWVDGLLSSVTFNLISGGTIYGDLNVLGTLSASTINVPLQYLYASGATIYNNLTVVGSLSATTISVPLQYFDVSGATVHGDMSVLGVLSARTLVAPLEYLILSGFTAYSDINVYGNANIHENLNVTGDTVLNNLSVSSMEIQNLNISNDLNVTGNTVLNNLTVTSMELSSLDISNDLNVTGDTVLNNVTVSGLTVNNDIVSNTLTINSDSIMNNLTINGLLTVTGISNVNVILFNTGITNGNIAGQLYYEKRDNALTYKPITPNNDVSINLGFEYVVNVYNDTGTLIPNGSACNAYGAFTIEGYSPFVLIRLANAAFSPNMALSASTANVAGIVTHDIPSGQTGIMTGYGIVRDFDTSAFNNGDVIFLSDSESGKFVTFNNLVSKCSRANRIGRVLTTGVTDGSIYVNIFNENEISEISQMRLNDLTINNASSGIISFAGFTINTDNTKFNIGAIHGWLADNSTDSHNPSITYIDYSGITGLTPTYLNNNPVTYIGIDKYLNIYQKETPFTNSETRTYIDLGVIVHSNQININAINNQPIVAVDAGSQLYDLMRGIGFFNISGNIYSANGSNLMINKSFGYIFKQGSNFTTDVRDPHKKYMEVVTGLTFNYRLQNSVEYSGYTNIDPNNYDLNGVRTPVDNNKFTIQRISIFSSNLTRIQYGQHQYGSKQEALEAIQTEIFVTEPNIEGNGLLRAFLILKKGITVLNNTDTAFFIEADRWGSKIGAGGTSVTDLQRAYNNSTNPEILTDTIRDGFTIRRGSTYETDHVFQIQDISGNTNMYVTGEGTLYSKYITGQTIKIGYDSNYIDINSSGTDRRYGTAMKWNVLRFPFTDKYINSSKIAHNYFNNSVVFSASTIYPTDLIPILCKIPHDWNTGSSIKPELQWIQTTSSVPNWLLAYKKIRNNSGITIETNFNNYILLTGLTAYTYTSSNLIQVTRFSDITMTDMNISDSISFILFRDYTNVSTLFSAETNNLDIHALELDVKYKSDTLGSNTEYVKY